MKILIRTLSWGVFMFSTLYKIFGNGEWTNEQMIAGVAMATWLSSWANGIKE